MKDYRLPENRLEVFKDFYWLHSKYGIHPGLVYLYLPILTKDMTQEQKYWVAFLEGCTQNPNTVYAILKYFPDRPYTEEEVKMFEEFHNYVYDKLDYDTDRIHHKGQLVKQLIKYNEIVGPSSVDMFERQLYSEDPKQWFTNVFEFILNKVWGFGRMSAWSYTEFIKICCNLKYEFCNYYMTDHDSSMSMRNGLLLLYGYDDLHIWKELPNNPKTHSKELMEWAEQEVRALEQYLKTQYTDIEVKAETLESILCAFKNMIRGRRYPNIYTDMSYDRIKKAESLWGNQIDFSIFWKIRETYLPKELLKEFNYNGYINDTEEKGVHKGKQMYFRETGQPLFLDLFFDKYKSDIIIDYSEVKRHVDNEMEKVVKEVKTTTNTKPVKVNNIDYSYLLGRFEEETPLTKEELRVVKANHHRTQALVGDTIYTGELGLHNCWEDRLYDLTPIQLKVDGDKSMLFKREDYFAPLGYGGINGAKLRQALYLGSKQVKGKNWDMVITGATSISPQLPMTCAIASYYGLPVIGLSSADSSDMLDISRGFGGQFTKTKIGYNTYIQQQLMLKKKELEEQGHKPFVFHYGLTIDFDNSSKEDIQEFYGVGANQVRSLIGTAAEDLIIALGSSNSAIAVTYGLLKYHKEVPVKNLHLIGVGPSTLEKFKTRLEILAGYEGLNLTEVFNFNTEEKHENKINVIYYDTHAKKLWEYTDRIYERFADIDFHYTYEGKMVRFLKVFHPELIKETSCFWIIGSCLDKHRLEKYYLAT